MDSWWPWSSLFPPPPPRDLHCTRNHKSSSPGAWNYPYSFGWPTMGIQFCENASPPFTFRSDSRSGRITGVRNAKTRRLSRTGLIFFKKPSLNLGSTPMTFITSTGLFSQQDWRQPWRLLRSGYYGQRSPLQPGNSEWVTVIQYTNASWWALPPCVIFNGKVFIKSWSDGRSPGRLTIRSWGLLWNLTSMGRKTLRSFDNSTFNTRRQWKSFNPEIWRNMRGK